jgi:Ribbon-helix-helix protein, copG family
MVRTQISLSKAQYDRAKREARRLGISLAELFRRALAAVLPRDSHKPWMKYRGLVTSGDKDSSRKIDDLIYGGKD